MARRRITYRALTDSRIYARGRRFYLYSAEPMENPQTGKVVKWIGLCNVSEGPERARELAACIINRARQGQGRGDMPAHIEAFRLKLLKRREADRPREPARVKLFEDGSKEITRAYGVIKDAFADFDVEQVRPADIAAFVDQWEGRRMAQVYLGRLSAFFAWAARKGLRNDNPCREVKVEKAKGRDRYITDAEFYAAYDALLIGKDKRPTPSGPMVQCYVELCYLLYQRTTEVRLLKWSDVDMDAGVIYFKPTKTERSSGAKVAVPISAQVKAALERARNLGKVKSVYVIHNLDGKPYTAHGIGTAWERACERAGVYDATLKDLRAKAATDAKRAGFSKAQISVGLAHASVEMTESYIRLREVPTSEVVLALPKRNNA